MKQTFVALCSSVMIISILKVWPPESFLHIKACFQHRKKVRRFVGIVIRHGPIVPNWAPCWPHESCYQGNEVKKIPRKKCEFFLYKNFVLHTIANEALIAFANLIPQGKLFAETMSYSCIMNFPTVVYIVVAKCNLEYHQSKGKYSHSKWE